MGLRSRSRGLCVRGHQTLKSRSGDKGLARVHQPATEAAWDAVHEALPARWRVGPITFDPGRPAFSVTAIGPHPGRGKIPQSVSGIGEDESAALGDLDDRLRGIPRPDGTRMDELRRRLRLAYLDGAEEWASRELGRGLTRDELGRVIGRYGGV